MTLSGFKTSAQPKKLPRNHLISLTVEHLSPQFTVEYVLFARSIPNIHSSEESRNLGGARQ
ncbi:hypothetical protein PCANC_20238 [Puccinia coronata f. sp. avenae]|uniref:Uncharacterized protein n=1 Tax=Puccinia coronata f. sp. avenae TaxID=200324 RepID=A0A2N5SF44_9BASI|nr:hypothetical protein PCANC_20238 [Puccinia coronata f. sp. avenae]